MSKQCAKCMKTVFPVEELKCLDKVWHKGCFRCQECGMSLNMKNYKGYNKLPYCNAHYPKTTHTAVADTPESRRIAENTKIQSNIQYHKDFERMKDQFTPVVDTPDLKRVRDNTKNISLIKYHAEFEKSKGAKISIADDPETKRVRKNMETISNISYHGDLDKRSKMEMNRPVEQEANQHRRRPGSTGDYEPRARQPGSISDYDPKANKGGTPYSQRQSQGTAVYDSRTGVVYENPMAYQGGNPHNLGNRAPQQQGGQSPAYAVWQPSSSRVVQNGSQGRKVGSISDYDPVNEKYGSIAGQYSGYQQQAQAQQPPPPPPPQQEDPVPQYNPVEVPPPHMDEEEPTTNIPPVTVKEEQVSTTPIVPPIPDDSADVSAEKDAISAQEEDPTQPQQARQPAYQPPPPQQQQQQPYRPPGQPQRNQVKYVALYDYTAADDDEVSFREEDFIINCEIIDPGWMEGTVERTGQRGMLPSNYVEMAS
ncbi:LIM and SH3 domain protein 1-like isoform X3 [Mizuhopecten yessoensis]|uniref:LIM and SH3 domain protein 1-like isoform X3 n=1 Tax=Mizuhopecten yessoensis TaxID=6573 RepID=UPI000B458FAB|nr:LIM and SH3 domain protein 1-like isoform X3 [Mizuhopecten yessoensis]